MVVIRGGVSRGHQVGPRPVELARFMPYGERQDGVPRGCQCRSKTPQFRCFGDAPDQSSMRVFFWGSPSLISEAAAERSPQAKRKAAAKRTRSGNAVHDFRGLLWQLGTLTMNRVEPSGPGKPGFDVPSSKTPVQDQTLRRLNAKSPCGSPPSEACPVAARPESKNMPDVQEFAQNPHGTSV